MPLYYFDVETSGEIETDTVGTDLPWPAMIAEMARDLCLRVAQEQLTDGSSVAVRVRAAKGPTFYLASLTLSGSLT